MPCAAAGHACRTHMIGLREVPAHFPSLFFTANGVVLNAGLRLG